MKLKIIDIAHHRNGVSGAPFDAVLFEDAGSQGSRKIAIVFEVRDLCAVLDIARLAAGDNAFGSKSRRGDDESDLRKVVKAYDEASLNSVFNPKS
jgi:hypothetical protein